MYKFIYILPFLLMLNNLKAQVKLTNKSIPTFDNKFYAKIIKDTVITNNFQFEKSGTNNLWDFSNLAYGSLDTIYYLNPKQTPYFDTFPTSNLVRYFHDDFYGDQFYYLKRDSMSLSIVGSYSIIFGITNKNTTNHFIPEYNWFQFPTEKGNEFERIYNVKSPTYKRPPWAAYDSVYIKSYINNQSKFVASGFIKLNSGTFPCLLEEVTQNSIDSTYSSDTCKNCPWVPDINGWGYGRSFNWYISNSIEPVATFHESLFNYNKIIVRTDSIKLSSVSDINNLNFNIYPNPASSKLFIENMYLKNSSYVITDVSGREILKDKLQSEINIEDLQQGIYIINLYSNNELYGRKRFVKQ